MRVSLAVLCAMIPLCAQAAPEGLANTLTVQSEAISKIAPDQVTVSVAVQEENKDEKLAKQKHDEKLKKLLQIAEGAGIDKEHMRTGYTSLEPQYDWADGKPHFRSYVAHTNIELTLTDITHLAHLMEAVADAGISIDNVAYGLQNEKVAQEDTLVKAMEHAYSKASRIAGAAHVTLGNPLMIEEDAEAPNYPRPMRMMSVLRAVPATAPAPPELPSGMIEIHETVTVTYQIKPQ